MKVIKKTKDYVVYQKGSGRYAVKDAERNWVNADEKIKILLAEGLIKAVMPAAPVVGEEPVEEVTAVEEAPVEEAPVEEAKAEVEENQWSRLRPKMLPSALRRPLVLSPNSAATP